MSDSNQLSRRGFLQQSLAFSALTGMTGALPAFVRQQAGQHDSGAHHLLMVGDWGRDNSQVGQRAVAAAMQQYASSRGIKTDALLMLGDSWYGELEGGTKSPRWQWQFEDMYPKSAFDCPAYSIAGNHDYQMWPGSKLEAELAYAKIPGTRWTMPSLWYSFDFPRVRPMMTVIALDSNMPHPIKAGSRDFTLTEAQRLQQMTWLEAELSKPRSSPFLVVMGHHPVYSDGPHGDHAMLIRDWDPLLRKHRAHLYLAGHDHDLQHLEFEGHPTSFFLSGGGGADLYDLKIQPGDRGPFAEKVFGFSHMELTREKITMRHVDSTGKILHGFTKAPDGRITLLA